MRQSWKHHGDYGGAGSWPAVADMATATCIMLVLFWMAGTWQLQKSKHLHDEDLKNIAKLTSEFVALKEELERITSDYQALLGGKVDLAAENRRLKETVRDFEAQIKSLKQANERLKGNIDVIAKLDAERLKLQNVIAQLKTSMEVLKQLHRKPPNIVLSEGKQYTFKSGNAAISGEFADRFKQNEMKKVIEALNSTSNVEVVEIIGHTDRQPVRKKSSNLDAELYRVLSGECPVDSLEFASNCELGLARAIAVQDLLSKCLHDLKSATGNDLTTEGRTRLNRLMFRTYSGAQLFPVNPDRFKTNSGELAEQNVEEDRRIEIRFTRLRDVDVSSASE